MTVQPRIVLIAGPNGAGKTTFAKQYLLLDATPFTYLNADEIAREPDLVGMPTGRRDIAAARRLLDRIASLCGQRADLMVETTLSLKTYANLIPHWQGLGYRIELCYLRLSSVDDALARVQTRVAAGGHDVPPEVIRRRFDRSLRLLSEVYSDLVDELYIFDWGVGGYRLTEHRTR